MCDISVLRLAKHEKNKKRRKKTTRVDSLFQTLVREGNSSVYRFAYMSLTFTMRTFVQLLSSAHLRPY
jgi:hypothetical protein